jgi:hypothetical protein
MEWKKGERIMAKLLLRWCRYNTQFCHLLAGIVTSAEINNIFTRKQELWSENSRPLLGNGL